MTSPSPLPPVPVASQDIAALPRISIRYCTQCRWMLRAAYFAQELLSTFTPPNSPTAIIAEVALLPTSGGTFTVELTHSTPSSTSAPEASSADVRKVTLWDRKAEGGFPETKELKRRVRDILDPERGLGHIDRGVTAPSQGDDAVKRSNVVEEKSTEPIDRKSEKDCESGTC